MKDIRVIIDDLLRHRDAFFSFGAIVVCLIFLNNIYSSENVKIKKLQTQIQEESRRNELFSQIGEIDKKFNKLLSYKKLSSTDRTKLLNYISSSAAKYGLKIDTINFGKENVQDFIIFIPIQLGLAGKFHNFGTFVGDIENSDFYLKFSDVKINRISELGEQEPIERFDLIINAVIVKENDG